MLLLTNGAQIDACKCRNGQKNMRSARASTLAAGRSAWQAQQCVQCSSSHHPGNHSVPEQCKRDPPKHTMRRALHNFWLGHGALIPSLPIRAFRTWVPAHAPSRARRVSAVVYKTTNYFYKPHVDLAVMAASAMTAASASAASGGKGHRTFEQN